MNQDATISPKPDAKSEPQVRCIRLVRWLGGLLKRRPKIEREQCPVCKGMGLVMWKPIGLLYQIPCKNCNGIGEVEKPLNDKLTDAGPVTL